MRRRLCQIAALVLLASLVVAPPAFSGVSAGSISGNGQVLLFSGFGQNAALNIQISGSWTGTIQFEATFDGGATWFSIQGIVLNGSGFTIGSTTTSTTVAGQFTFNPSGYDIIRLRSSSWTSGTANVTYAVSVNAQNGGGTAASLGTVSQGAGGSLANAWTTKITDGTNGPAAVKPASTAAAAADPSLVVGLSPNSPLPSGANTVGAVTQGSAPWTQRIQDGTGATLAAVTAANALKVDGSAVTQPVSGTVTATQGTAAGLGGAWPAKITDGTNTMPTMDAAARAGFHKLTDGTNTATVKAANTAPVAADTSLVVSLHPQGSLVCPSVAAINQTASTQVITGSASKKIYICSIMLVSATAQNIGVIEGTGTTCGTASTALIGGTTASVAVAPNGGWSTVSGTPWLVTQTAADNLCVLQSSTGNVSGVITYIQQ